MSDIEQEAIKLAGMDDRRLAEVRERAMSAMALVQLVDAYKGQVGRIAVSLATGNFDPAETYGELMNARAAFERDADNLHIEIERALAREIACGMPGTNPDEADIDAAVTALRVSLLSSGPTL